MKQYTNETIAVLWDAEKCIHSAKCVHGLPSVFKPGERPWINIEHAPSEDIMRVIDMCPSGALSYKKLQTTEGTTTVEQTTTAQPSTEIKVLKQGPLLIKGVCTLLDADGNEITTNESFALCRCGQSNKKPFCDGTHKTIGFQG